MVIKGWDIGIATMKVGEKAELICAPDYAYGSEGRYNLIYTRLYFLYIYILFNA